MITHYDLTEIRNMDWRDRLSGSSIRITFVNCLIIMLKYIILSLELQVQNTENIFRKYINAGKKLATVLQYFS